MHGVWSLYLLFQRKTTQFLPGLDRQGAVRRQGSTTIHVQTTHVATTLMNGLVAIMRRI
jgi:hypothetical protein